MCSDNERVRVATQLRRQTTAAAWVCHPHDKDQVMIVDAARKHEPASWNHQKYARANARTL